MAKRQTDTDQNLFPFAVVPQREEPDSVLTLVETSKPLDATPGVAAQQLGAQASRRRRTGRPELRALGAQAPRLGAQIVGSGRPGAQKKNRFDSSSEAACPSRIEDGRFHLRVDAKLLAVMKKECETVEPHLKLNAVTEDAWRLWLRERAKAKLGAQAPTCSSSGSSSGLNTDPEETLNQDLDLTTTTTTTTLGVQAPKTVKLPGFAAAVLEHQPHDSKHSQEMNLAYAWEAHRAGQGIKAPDVWAISNWRTGKADKLIDLWVARKEREATEKSTRRDANTWSRILEVLRRRMSAKDFARWIEPIQFERIDEAHHVILLRAPNQTIKDTVVTNHGKDFAVALTELQLSGFSVAWSIGVA